MPQHPLACIRVGAWGKGSEDAVTDFSNGNAAMQPSPYSFAAHKHSVATDTFRTTFKGERYRKKFESGLATGLASSNVKCLGELALNFPLSAPLVRSLVRELRYYTELTTLNLAGANLPPKVS